MSIANLKGGDFNISVNDIITNTVEAASIITNNVVVNDYVEFPGTVDPFIPGYIVNDSRNTISAPVGFTGALNIASPGGGTNTVMRFGDWVQLVYKNTAAPAAALNSVDPITLTGNLPDDMCPPETLEFYGPATSAGVVVYAKWTIYDDGTITIGSAANDHWTALDLIGLKDFSFVYKANGA